MISGPISVMPAELPKPRIRTVRGALVVPNTVDADDSPHGVFDRRDHFLPLSQARMSRERVSAPPPMQEPSFHLNGTYLYAGFSHRHFGHFMLESLVRLWALDHVDDKIDGIVLPARAEMAMRYNLNNSLKPVKHRFCGDLPLRLLESPTRIDRLILPTPGFGHGPWLGGTQEFRAYAHNRFAQIEVDGAEKLYLSRRHLKRDHQLVDQEETIEAMMEEAGYFVLHPEKYHLEVQLGAIRAARKIVGADGSAFHLVPFAMDRDARAAIFMRRQRKDILTFLSRQMQGFAGVTPTLIDPRAQPKNKSIPAPLDIDVLRARLQEDGFL